MQAGQNDKKAFRIDMRNRGCIVGIIYFEFQTISMGAVAQSLPRTGSASTRGPQMLISP